MTKSIRTVPTSSHWDNYRVEDSDGNRRGREPFVEVDWDTALDIAASALERLRSEFGNVSIYAGFYGWASSGRFHHAQGQLKQFVNLIGG